MKKHTQLLLSIAFTILTQGNWIQAQVNPEEDEIITLPAFEVSTENDRGYYASNTISGTRMQTPLKYLPQTVNVITSEFIDDTAAVDISDIMQYSPSIEPATQAGENRFAIRGFTQFSVALNGITTSAFNRWDSAIIDRVEAVKGPSAALYGGTFEPGGFINILTKKPQPTGATTVSLDFDTENLIRGVLDTTGPLVTNDEGDAILMYRLIAVGQEGSHRGFVDFVDGERSIFAPSLTWKVSQRTSLTIEYYNDSYDQDAFPTAVVPIRRDPGFNQNAFFLDEVVKEIGEGFNINGPNSFDNFDGEALTINLTHRFNENFSMRALYQYTELFESFLRNNSFFLDSLNPATVNSNVLTRDFGEDRRTFRVDANLKKDFGWGQFSGLFGIQSDTTDSTETRAVDPNDGPIEIFTATATDLILNDPGTFTVNQNQLTESEDVIIWNFVLSQSLLNERLKFIGGVSGSFDDGQSRLIQFHQGQTRDSVPFQDNASDPEDWQLGVLFEVTRNINLFALHAEDDRLNVFNGNTPDPDDRFPNIISESDEFGVKIDMQNGMSGAISYFEIERSNLVRRDFSQENAPQLPSGTESAKGVELELFYTPENLENLSMVLAYSYLDGETKGFSGDEAIFNGSPLRNAARNSLKFWGKYKFDNGFSLGLGIIYRDEQSPFGGVLQAERPFAMAPSHTLVNMSAGYRFTFSDGRVLNLQVNVDNLTDETHMVANNFGPGTTANFRASFTF